MRRMRAVATMMAAAITLWAAPPTLAADAAPAAKPSPAKSSAAKTGGAKAGGAKGGKAAKSGAAKKALSVEATIEGSQVRDFRAFCDSWMLKLRDRETYNMAHITWETHDGRVSGENVGYGAESSCSAREDPGKDPIGKLTYREMRYRREGATQAEALAAPGTIIEQSDVTEIFRFGKGRWQY